MIETVTSRYYRGFAEELSGKRVLEIGCGHGFGARAIRKYLSPKRVIATDLDPRMIDSASKMVDDPAVVFEVADAAKLPYEDNSFDAVFDYGAIHHIPGLLWKSCCKELYRVLSRHGKVFIYDNSIESFSTIWGRINRIMTDHPYESMYKKTELLDYLISLGLKIKKEVSLGRYFIAIAEK